MGDEGMLTHRPDPVDPSRVRQGFRRATAVLRPLPNVLLVGGVRCGSTSLYRYLLACEAAGPMPPAYKEIHFFDRSLDRGPLWYRSRFAMRPRSIVVDPTPAYLCEPGVAASAAAVLPKAKVVVVLRDPYDRAASHFAWRTRKGVEPAPTLVAALADDQNRRADHRTSLGAYGLHSEYDVALGAWYDAYPKDQVCVLIAERLFSGDADELARVRHFLGLRADTSFPRTNWGSDKGAEEQLDGRFNDTIAGVEAITGRDTGWAKR